MFNRAQEFFHLTLNMYLSLNIYFEVHPCVQEDLDAPTLKGSGSGACLPGLKMDAKDIAAGTALISGRQQSQVGGSADDAADVILAPTLPLGKRVHGFRGTYGAAIIAVLCAVLSLTVRKKCPFDVMFPAEAVVLPPARKPLLDKP